MANILFLDIETTGLCPNRNQTVEVAIVPVMHGQIHDRNILHYYVEHPVLTFDADALRLFGPRITDRKAGVPVFDTFQAFDETKKFITRYTDRTYEPGIKPYIGGKNVAGFDRPFLSRLIVGFEDWVKHRVVDIGNLFHRADDSDLLDLAGCRKRGIDMGMKISHNVTHTALDDAMLCAELYCGWYARDIASRGC